MTRRQDDVVTIIVEPSSGILRAAWAGQLLTGSLIDSYYQLLEVAVAQGCRYWHLDLRMSIWPAATFMHWFTDTFAPHATQRLGGPVYVAGWVAEHNQAHVEDPSTVAMQQRVAQVNFYPAFFTSEAQARAWLLQQQAHDATEAEG